MIVDTSAIVAIVLNEPERDRLVEAILDATDPQVSAASRVEIAAVLVRRLTPEDYRRVERLIERLGIRTVPFDGKQATSAARAYRDFGRGSGHRAGLNLGDAASYALSKTAGEPLLFKGDDFARTDMERA